MSKLIDCPGCEKPIGANAYTCLHRGYRRTSPVAWLFAIVLIVIFATAIFGSAQAQETGIRLAQEGDWYQKLTRDLGFVRSIAYASLYTTHYDPNPEHVNHQNMLGFELETKEKQVYGLAIFDNSFGQKSEYLYIGEEMAQLPLGADVFQAYRGIAPRLRRALRRQDPVKWPGHSTGAGAYSRLSAQGVVH